MALGGGIELQVTCNSTETVTLQRDTSGAFGSPVTLLEGAPGGVQNYVDPLPIDGTTYYYRAKVSRGGFADSSWSSTLSAKPVLLT